MSDKVKDKTVAPLQISAEQILLEAFERREQPLKHQKKKFNDLDELQDFQARKRKEFEDALTRKRQDIPQWQRYAQFELDQKEYDRARSIFERALTVDPYNVPLWLKYIQSEMKERNINHARNLLDRSVAALPRVEKLWYNYVSLEEALSNFQGLRQVFERWMSWRPSSPAWLAYIDMEKRYKEYERAREIFTRLTAVHPEAPNWIKWAAFEEDIGAVSNVRQVYENAVETAVQSGIEWADEEILIRWTKWEAKHQEFERARSIFKLFLEQIPSSRAARLYSEYTKFEKQFGDREGIETLVLAKRRKQYEETIKQDPHDYDTWFSYIQLLKETTANKRETREIFERAIQNHPTVLEKENWRRYVFLWISYAVFEEIQGDVDRARAVYRKCLDLIPHRHFTFGKIWVLFAKFEIRHGNLHAARKLLGRALGLSQKPSVYKSYLEVEKQLREFERCRKLYEGFIQQYPENSKAWVDFAGLEQDLGDIDRARAIFEKAVGLDEMETPELVWKRYIEFETEEGYIENARALYERLLGTVREVKVWISYAMFELTAVQLREEEKRDDDDDNNNNDNEAQPTSESIENARGVFDRAWDAFKNTSSTDAKVVLLDAWEQFENQFGNQGTLQRVVKLKPSLVKKRRRLEDGSYEEYEDYVFPAEGKLSKILENARKWKQSSQ